MAVSAAEPFTVPNGRTDLDLLHSATSSRAVAGDYSDALQAEIDRRHNPDLFGESSGFTASIASPAQQSPPPPVGEGAKGVIDLATTAKDLDTAADTVLGLESTGDQTLTDEIGEYEETVEATGVAERRPPAGSLLVREAAAAAVVQAPATRLANVPVPAISPAPVMAVAPTKPDEASAPHVAPVPDPDPAQDKKRAAVEPVDDPTATKRAKNDDEVEEVADTAAPSPPPMAAAGDAEMPDAAIPEVPKLVAKKKKKKKKSQKASTGNVKAKGKTKGKADAAPKPKANVKADAASTPKTNTKTKVRFEASETTKPKPKSKSKSKSKAAPAKAKPKRQALVDDVVEEGGEESVLSRRLRLMLRTVASDGWVHVGNLEERVRKRKTLLAGVRACGYDTLEHLLLASTDTTTSLQVTQAKRDTATLHRHLRSADVAGTIEGLAARYMDDAWHFRLYKDQSEKYADEISYGVEEDDDVTKALKKREKASDDAVPNLADLVVDDGEVEYMSDDDGDDIAVPMSRTHKTKARMKRDRALDELAAARQLQSANDSDDDILSEMLRDLGDGDGDATGAKAATEAMSAQTSKRRLYKAPGSGKAKKGAKKGGGDDETPKWKAEEIDAVVERPAQNWPEYELLRSTVSDRLRPAGRLVSDQSLDIMEGFDTAAAVFMHLARHWLTPGLPANSKAAAAVVVTTVLSKLRDLPAEVKAQADDTFSVMHRRVVALSKSDPKRRSVFTQLVSSLWSDTMHVTEVTMGADTEPNKYTCAWTHAPLRPGDQVYMVADFSKKNSKVNLKYVSRAPGTVPELYIWAISSVRSFAKFTTVFSRHILNWQESESFSPSVSADMRMRRFVQDARAVQIAAEAIATFLANKFVATRVVQ